MITNISHQLLDYTITFVYQKAYNKDNNNVFSEDGSREVTGGALESAPSAPPDSCGRNILFQISGRGGICTLCPTAAHASVDTALFS